MKLSIVVPIYNVENYIIRCIESIITQEIADYEIILINDGSKDSSLEFCNQMAKQYSFIRVINQENAGVAAARNKGLELATGEFVYFIDPDDYLLSDGLSQIYEKLESIDSDCVVLNYQDIVEYNDKIIDISTRELPFTGKLTRNSFHKKFDTLFKTRMFYSVWNKIYRVSFLRENKIHFQSYRIGEDTRFNFEVYKNLDSIYLSDITIYGYIQGRSGSAMTTYNPDRLKYQLNEVEELSELIKTWEIDDKALIKYVLHGIATSNIRNISHSSLSYRKKTQLIKEIAINPIFDPVFETRPKKMSKILYFLIKLKRYGMIIVLLNIKMNWKRMI